MPPSARKRGTRFPHLRLHRFKRSRLLPRVRKVLGILHALSPETLLDIGTGRGAFLWPLLDHAPTCPSGQLLLQSRGHYLRGGAREKHFALFKTWATLHQDALRDQLGTRCVMYGEWAYAKHTVFYDRLPHHFLEFDLFDRDRQIFLSTDRPAEVLDGTPVVSVPALARGHFDSLDALVQHVASPREPRIQVHVVGLHAAVLIHTPELAEAQTQLGAADHRFVLDVVSRVVGVTQHAASLELSQHARLHATGHLRDLALGRCPRLGKDCSVAVTSVHAVEHEQVSMGIQDGRDQVQDRPWLPCHGEACASYGAS